MIFKKRMKDFMFVSIQFALFIVYFFSINIIDIGIPGIFRTLGLIIACNGLVILTVSLFQLNKNLSPFPSPKSDTKLIRQGLYSFIRHPIYTGILLLALGYASYTNSFYRFLITIVLYILFYMKSLYEEKLLNEKFSAYQEYVKSTGRFFPKL